MSKKKIKEYLIEKEVYHAGYDFLIDLISDQISLYKIARKTIREEGMSVPGSNINKKDSEGDNVIFFYVRNQHLKTLQECIQNITSLTTKLGLSVKDSAIIRDLVGDPEEDDGMDDDE